MVTAQMCLARIQVIMTPLVSIRRLRAKQQNFGNPFPLHLASAGSNVEIAALDPTRLSAINVGMLIWPFLNGQTPPGHRDK